MNEPTADDALKAALRGERPAKIPATWVGSPTQSSKGWRWDDPDSAGNSVRIFEGNPDDQNPAHREPFVIVVRNGEVLGTDKQPITDPEIIKEALTEHY